MKWFIHKMLPSQMLVKGVTEKQFQFAGKSKNDKGYNLS